MAHPGLIGLAVGCVLAGLAARHDATAQPLTCSQCSDLHEEATVRLQMIATREALKQELGWSAEIGQRIDMEIAALNAMGGGLTPADVDACYRTCRFGLDRTLTQMRNETPTVVTSNCAPCEASVAVANDALETLQTAARQSDSEGTLRGILTERDQAVDALMACEQQACRDAYSRKNAQPLTAADYQRALRETADPRVWVVEPVDVTSLPDYAVSIQPFGADLGE